MAILPSMVDSGVLEEKALEPVRRRQPEEVAATAVGAPGLPAATVQAVEAEGEETPTRVGAQLAIQAVAADLPVARARSVVMVVKVK